RRDALGLARMLSLGEITAVRTPTIEQEGLRDVSRARQRAVGDLSHARQRIMSCCCATVCTTARMLGRLGPIMTGWLANGYSRPPRRWRLPPNWRPNPC